MGARRVVHRDRRGRPSATLVWRADAALESASVRIPDGSWVSIEPRAGDDAPWGPYDRLWRGADADAREESLTVFSAVEWARIATIPLLAEPARLPAGAGTAVLNLLATLAREQDIPRLAYHGPYPTEALFLALLECFRPEPAGGDLLARFMANDLAWVPAPFTASFEDTAYVQWRDARVEKVVWQSRTYFRADWGTVRRHAPLRVHDEDDGVRCSLWAFGSPLAHHLVLDPDGTPHVVARGEASAGHARRLTPSVRDGLIALVVALSAPPLAAPLRDVAADLAFTVGPVSFELAEVTGSEVRIAKRAAAAFARHLAEPAAPDMRAQRALSALTELAVTMADPLRQRAQARLAAAPVTAQTAAFAERTEDPTAARTITAAVAAVLASGRVDHEPDVEGDESHDRDD